MDKIININDYKIGKNEPVFIIAEVGVNHNGDLELAKKLIKEAARCGADCVKFQTFKADKLVTKAAKKANYQSLNIKDSDNSQYNMLKNLELSHNDHLELLDYCYKKKIKFFYSNYSIYYPFFLLNY